MTDPGHVGTADVAPPPFIANDRLGAGGLLGWHPPLWHAWTGSGVLGSTTSAAPEQPVRSESPPSSRARGLHPSRLFPSVAWQRERTGERRRVAPVLLLLFLLGA